MKSFYQPNKRQNKASFDMNKAKEIWHFLMFFPNISCFFIALTFLCHPTIAQTQSGAEFDASTLFETKWKYTYMTHTESNTVIHKAQNDYNYLLYFKIDNTYEQFLNGVRQKGGWAMNGRRLNYSFRKASFFEIKGISSNNLVLEFEQAPGKGHFQYHFVTVDDAKAPFELPLNQLPEVKVKAQRTKIDKAPWWSFGTKNKKKIVVEPKIEAPYLNIEITGGGFYGGADPVYRDYIRIKTDGKLIKEFISQHRGSIVTKRVIPREELDLFMQFVTEKGYFDFERLYDCTFNACQIRKKSVPRPIPLQICIAYGSRKKVVNVAIWGRDEKNMQYVDYPPALDAIIEAVQKMANRLK